MQYQAYKTDSKAYRGEMVVGGQLYWVSCRFDFGVWLCEAGEENPDKDHYHLPCSRHSVPWASRKSDITFRTHSCYREDAIALAEYEIADYRCI